MADKKDELDQRIEQVVNLAIENSHTLMRDHIKFLCDQIAFDREMTRRDIDLRERRVSIEERRAEANSKLFGAIPAYLELANTLLGRPGRASTPAYSPSEIFGGMWQSAVSGETGGVHPATPPDPSFNSDMPEGIKLIHCQGCGTLIPVKWDGGAVTICPFCLKEHAVTEIPDPTE